MIQTLQTLFAQSYDYTYSTPTTTTSSSSDVSGAAMAVIFLIIAVVALAAAIPTIIGMWKAFVKAGKPGWASLIPYYNTYVMVEISGRPVSWFWMLLAFSLLSAIPFVGFLLSIAVFVLMVIVSIDIAKAFGKDTGMGIVLVIFPFIGWPILGFGSARYIGSAGQHGGMPTPGQGMGPQYHQGGMQQPQGMAPTPTNTPFVGGNNDEHKQF